MYVQITDIVKKVRDKISPKKLMQKFIFTTFDSSRKEFKFSNMLLLFKDEELVQVKSCRPVRNKHVFEESDTDVMCVINKITINILTKEFTTDYVLETKDVYELTEEKEEKIRKIIDDFTENYCVEFLKSVK